MALAHVIGNMRTSRGLLGGSLGAYSPSLCAIRRARVAIGLSLSWRQSVKPSALRMLVAAYSHAWRAISAWSCPNVIRFAPHVQQAIQLSGSSPPNSTQSGLPHSWHSNLTAPMFTPTRSVDCQLLARTVPMTRIQSVSRGVGSGLPN